MDLRICDKAVLVTGGSQGIGRACAEALAAEGCRVAIAALVNFTKGLSDLGGRYNIRVTAVSPGAVQTERWNTRICLEAEATGRDYEELRAARITEQPLGRIVEPRDVADLVCCLVSPRADAVNGTCVTIDGGWSRGVYP